jgi:RNA polymerase sigma-70 factor (ECF subfamily)
MKHFLSRERDKARAMKRGGRNRVFSFDAVDAEKRYRFEPVDELTPEDIFERRWALTVLERALEKLRNELSEAGSADRYETLKGCLIGEEPKLPYRQAAEALGMTEGAVKAQVHRLRKRYGELLRQEIAETVSDPNDVDDELRYLLRVIAPFRAGIA